MSSSYHSGISSSPVYSFKPLVKPSVVRPQNSVPMTYRREPEGIEHNTVTEHTGSNMVCETVTLQFKKG